MKKHWWITGGLVALGLAASPLLAAERGGGLREHLVQLLHGGHGRCAEAGFEEHLERLADVLELTAQQRRDLAIALTARLDEIEPRLAALREAHRAQLAAIHAPTPDEDAIRAAARAMALEHEELAVSLSRLARDVHSTLTDEQLSWLRSRPHPDLLGRIDDHVEAVRDGVRAWADAQ